MEEALRPVAAMDGNMCDLTEVACKRGTASDLKRGLGTGEMLALQAWLGALASDLPSSLTAINADDVTHGLVFSRLLWKRP